MNPLLTPDLYPVPCTDPRWRFRVSGNAVTRKLTREECLKLGKRAVVHSRGLFGASDLSVGDYRVTEDRPELGPVRGWGRDPRWDSWIISKHDREIFRTQNYSFALRYVARVNGIL